MNSVADTTTPLLNELMHDISACCYPEILSKTIDRIKAEAKLNQWRNLENDDANDDNYRYPGRSIFNRELTLEIELTLDHQSLIIFTHLSDLDRQTTAWPRLVADGQFNVLFMAYQQYESKVKIVKALQNKWASRYQEVYTIIQSHHFLDSFQSDYADRKGVDMGITNKTINDGLSASENHPGLQFVFARTLRHLLLSVLFVEPLYSLVADFCT
jgi:hypothetical protein